MGDASDIEWTDATWNPVRGCVKVSPGCKHCYAETFAERFRGVPGHAYEQGFDPRLVPEMLDQPLRWARARMVFVNSMSDLFGDFVSMAYIAVVFGMMAAATRHRFQVLTKRAARMEAFFAWLAGQRVLPPLYFGTEGAHPARRACLWEAHREGAPLPDESSLPGWDVLSHGPWPLPHVWLGVSVEDRRYGLPRVEHLRHTPAAFRFLSIEPLLEELGELDLSGIDQVIIGGESGRGARPCNLAWIRSVVAQADAQGVAVFVKQVGSRPEGGGAPTLVQLRGKKQSKGGDPATWPADLAGRRELHAAWRPS